MKKIIALTAIALITSIYTLQAAEVLEEAIGLAHATYYGNLQKAQAYIGNEHRFLPLYGVTILHFAVQNNQLEITRYLLHEKRCDANAVTSQKYKCRSPLHLACINGNVAIARELLQAGADVHKLTSSEETPLWLACQAGHQDVAELLIHAGADGNDK